jgi:PKD repeat protein
MKNIKNYILAGFGFVASFPIFGQLSGNYTIGGTTSSTNYATWSDFATAFNNNGVSGAVNVTVMSSLSISATIQLTQNSTNPTTSTNTLTIDGNSKTLSGSPTYEMIWLNGVDYVQIKSLYLLHSGSNAMVQGIRFSGAANDNVVDGCTVDFSGMSSSTVPTGAYISFASSNSAIKTISTTHNGMRNTIKNCTFKTSSSNAPGPAYAIIDQQGSSFYSSVATNNSFVGNSIKNYYSSAFYVNYVNGDQFISNDISRETATNNSAVDSLMTIFYFHDAYSTSRSNYIGKNIIHDLPYKGASPSYSGKYLAGLTAIEIVSAYGTSNYPFTIELNKFSLLSFASYFNGIAIDNSELISIKQNEFYKVNGLTGTSTVVYATYCSDINTIGNKVRKCDFGSSNSGSLVTFYFIVVGCKTNSVNVIQSNVIDSVAAAIELYGFASLYDGSWLIDRNSITNNNVIASSSTFYGTFFYGLENISFKSNLVANNNSNTDNFSFWDVNYNTGFVLDIHQNTIYTRENNSNLNTYGFYVEDESSIIFVGNILDMKGSGNGIPAFLYSTTAIKLCNNNSFNISYGGGQSWYLGTNSFSNFSGWKSSSDVGPGESFVNPAFVNVAKNDFRSNCFETQNNVQYIKGNDIDVVAVNRNTKNSDRGSFENFMDLKLVKSDLNVTGKICAGAERTFSIIVKNNFVDTAYNFFVAYSVNGKVTRQKVTQKILPNDSQKITFTVPMLFLYSGINDIKVYIDLGDDNTSNDTLKYTATITASPGGSGMFASSKVTSPNTAIYQYGSSFDITIAGTPIYYDLKAPRLYSNTSYGSTSPNNWYASVQAQTKGGKSISGATLTAPTSSADLEVKFNTTDSTLEDSFIYIKVNVVDVNTGCDTTYKRMIYISPSPRFNFTYASKLCSGDTANFKNNSTLKSGYLNYTWNFGTGNAADTVNSVEPSFRFLNGGTFNVSFKAISSPYYFVFTKSYSVVVNTRPTVSFAKENACIGNDLKITNNTTPSTSTMSWDFGDGNGSVVNNKSSFVIQYTKSATYSVKLVADNGGCISSGTQKVIVFDKPIPDFTRQSGNCDYEKIAFLNNTTAGGSNFGSTWNFDDNGKTSVDKNPTYTFSTAGTKNIKLVVLSEFGCKDSITKKIGIKESPKVSFTNTQFCAISKTDFSNTTPVVNGTTANILWDFADGNTSTSDKVSYKWPTTGKRTISLTVTLDNGCQVKLSKDIDVLDEPSPNFVFQDKCSNDTIFLDNRSTGLGNIEYAWDFGDNDSSKLERPIHIYSVQQNKTFNITLTAKIIGGCSATLVKQINIYELPRTCDFNFTPDYASSFYGAKLEPIDKNANIGGQNNIDYSWNIVGLGNQSSKDVNAAVYFNLSGDGSYTASMNAKTRDGGCICFKSKQIVMDRASVNQSNLYGVSIFPNPAVSSLNISVPNGLDIQNVRLVNSIGAIVDLVESGNLNNVHSFDISQFSSGIYVISYSIYGKQFTSQIFIGTGRK